MNRRVILENEYNILIHFTGQTRYFGCQCFGDCSCGEDFKSEPIDFYQVKRKGKKTTKHTSIDSAMERWNFVNSLNK